MKPRHDRADFCRLFRRILVGTELTEIVVAAMWEVSQADTTLVVRLGAAPADSLTMYGTIYVRELG